MKKKITTLPEVNDIPHNHWMILDKQRNVLYYNKSLKNVLKKAKIYKVEEIIIELQYTKFITYFSPNRINTIVPILPS